MSLLDLLIKTGVVQKNRPTRNYNDFMDEYKSCCQFQPDFEQREDKGVAFKIQWLTKRMEKQLDS